MRLDKNYGGVVWSRHALARLAERGLTQGEVLRAFQHPTTSRWARSKRGIKYVRTEKDREIEVVVKKSPAPGGAGFEWVVLSCWSRAVGRVSERRGKLVDKLVRWLRDRIGRVTTLKH